MSEGNCIEKNYFDIMKFSIAKRQLAIGGGLKEETGGRTERTMWVNGNMTEEKGREREKESSL